MATGFAGDTPLQRRRIYLWFVLIRSKHEPFNRLAIDESIHNLRNVRSRNAPVKKVIGFDQNRHAGGTLIQTARCADARLDLCESTSGNLFFQCFIHFFRVLGRAASFRVVLSPTINADKEIALPLQRGESRVRRIGRQRPKISRNIRGNAPNFEFRRLLAYMVRSFDPSVSMSLPDHLEAEVTKWV